MHPSTRSGMAYENKIHSISKRISGAIPDTVKWNLTSAGSGLVAKVQQAHNSWVSVSSVYRCQHNNGRLYYVAIVSTRFSDTYAPKYVTIFNMNLSIIGEFRFSMRTGKLVNEILNVIL